ncbi:MAG: hypothetical protein IPL09_00030 [Bacteroidetes bacterium]|nr:hypothetical protein [Bacteroidota bacterium]
MGKSVSSTISQGKKIVCDENGNIYTSGILSSNFGLATDFDFGPNIYNLAPGVGNSNAYIAKYNSNGDFLWAKLLCPKF